MTSRNELRRRGCPVIRAALNEALPGLAAPRDPLKGVDPSVDILPGEVVEGVGFVRSGPSPASVTKQHLDRPNDREFAMSSTRLTRSYRELVAETRPTETPTPRTQETELDNLVQVLEERRRAEAESGDALQSDPIQQLRTIMVDALLPEFVSLVEKYAPKGVTLEMDASDLLEGGRGVRFEFQVGEHRIRLQGTTTADAIAFHETRRAPDVHGVIASGPMLRLRGLNASVFREFICERLCVLLRAVIKRR